MATCRVLSSGVCRITQPYHINGGKGYNYDHWGIDLVDFSAGYNALGWACAHSDGIVIETRNNCTGFEYNSYGNYVLLKHANGMYTMYAHFAYNTVQVRAGQSVSKGQKLGYLGNTGTSYGGHLHFECRQSNGYKIDPEAYLYADLPGMPSMKWVKKSGKWYLYDSSGKMLKGWQKVKGYWYYMDNNGVMQTGWHYDSSYKGWFYFSATGEMQTGWVSTGGKWYYLAPKTSGSDITGKMKKGWAYIKNKWYYLQEQKDKNHKEGEMRIGWFYDKNYKGWFLFAYSGEMLTGWQERSGKWFFLATETSGSDIKGKMKTGWLDRNGKRYYLNPKQTADCLEGEMLVGTHEIDGKEYTFDTNGALIS